MRTRPLAAHWRALRNVTEAEARPAPSPHAAAAETTTITTTRGTASGFSAR
ncbi:hypothetical protein ACFQZQ_10695 [Lysobacter koreensis]|uniref:Uncharacterized protein n=1 Tax=Lysobacter koreensis TaxID=266122 RepID=A0ABW2YMZ5_9GAMM